jgi:hypothetical protein
MSASKTTAVAQLWPAALVSMPILAVRDTRRDRLQWVDCRICYGLNWPRGSLVMTVAFVPNPMHPDPWWDGMLVVKR